MFYYKLFISLFISSLCTNLRGAHSIKRTPDFIQGLISWRSVIEPTDKPENHKIQTEDGLIEIFPFLPLRMQFLLTVGNKIPLFGPNCYNSVTYVYQQSFRREASARSFKTFLETFCLKVSADEDLQVGDIAIIKTYSSHRESPLISHTFLYLGDNLFFTKNGLKKDEPYKIATLNEILKVYSRPHHQEDYVQLTPEKENELVRSFLEKHQSTRKDQPHLCHHDEVLLNFVHFERMISTKPYQQKNSEFCEIERSVSFPDEAPFCHKLTESDVIGLKVKKFEFLLDGLQKDFTTLHSPYIISELSELNPIFVADYIEISSHPSSSPLLKRAREREDDFNDIIKYLLSETLSNSPQPTSAYKRLKKFVNKMRSNSRAALRSRL